MKKILILGIVSLVLFSCSVVGSGEVKLEKRNLENFKNIIVKGNVKVEISPEIDTSFFIIEAQENLLHKIKTNVKDNVLIIKVGGIDFTKSKEIKISTSINNLSSIKLADKVKMNSKDFNAQRDSLDNLDIELSGNSSLKLENITIKGLTKIVLKEETALEMENCFGISQEIFMDGNSSYEAYHFFTNNINIETKSSNDAKLAARNLISAKIFGDGNVSYIGNPRIEKELKGKGEIRTR